MNTIERYIFKRVLISAVGATVLIVALVWVSQALTQINFATSSGGSIGALLHFMSLLIPQFFTSVLPFSLVIAIVQVLNTMNLDSEAPVLASAGYGRWQLARPILILCALVSAYVLFSSHVIEPYTNAKSRTVAVEARSDLIRNFLREGRFERIEDNLTIFVDRKTAEGFEGVMISDARDPKMDLLYFAKTGAVSKIDGDTLLIMQDGQIHRKPEGAQDVTVIRYQSYAISLSQFSNGNGSTFFSVREQPTSYLRDPDPNDRIVQFNPGAARAEIYRRNSDWLHIILIGMVGLVLAGKPRSHRGGHFTTYVLAFGCALFYRGLAGVAVNLNKLTADLLWIFYAIPFAGLALTIWMYATGRTLEMPDFILTYYDRALALVKDRRVAFAKRRNA